MSGPTKCCLPDSVVWYPARRNQCAMVGVAAGSSAPLSKAPIRDGSIPASIEKRDGAQSGKLQ